MQEDNSTKNKVVSNLIWRYAERCGAQLVAFVVQIVLARILIPEAYGTVALITVFTNILQVFVDSGLGTALIQKKDADNIDFSSVFYTNIVFCLILYTLMFLSAPAIAGFYHNAELISLIRVLSITVVISGVKNVQQAYVSKHMMFRKFFFSTLGGTVIAAIVGIAMAMSGLGVWALVVQQVTNVTIDTLILWITVKWRPQKIFSVNRLIELFSFGWKLLISGLLDKLYMEIRQLLIGKIYTPSDLAYYNRGNQFPNFIVTNINTSIDSVLLPVMSLEQNDTVRIKQMTQRAIQISSYIMWPIMIGLMATAEPIVKFLLTDKWISCIPFLRVFCFTYALYPIHTANLNAIKAVGRSDLFLKMEIVKKFVGMAVLLITIRQGVMFMAYSMLFVSIFSSFVNAYPNKKLLNYSYKEQVKDVLPSMILSAVMGILVYFIQKLPFNYIFLLVCQIVAGIIIYIIGSQIGKLDSFYYIRDVLKIYIKKMKRL